MSIRKLFDYDLETNFKWRMSGNKGFISIDKMETSHLYNTLKMIWNHSVPDYTYIVQPFKKYSLFGPHYTPEYMLKSMKFMLEELGRRDDVTDKMMEGITYMAAMFNTIKTELLC